MRKCVYIPKEINRIIKQSGLLNSFSYNQLIIHSIYSYLPIFLNDKTQQEDLIKYAEVTKKRYYREMLLTLRKEEKSRYYFFTRFLSEFRKMLNRSITDNTLKKKWLLSIIDIYIKESQSYEDNQIITDFLINFKDKIKQSRRDINELKEFLNISVQKIDHKHKENIYRKNEDR